MVRYTLLTSLLVAGASALPAQPPSDNSVTPRGNSAEPVSTAECKYNPPDGTGFNRDVMRTAVAYPLCEAIQDGTLKAGPIMVNGKQRFEDDTALNIEYVYDAGCMGYRLSSNRYVAFMCEPGNNKFETYRCLNSFERIMNDCAAEKNMGGNVHDDAGTMYYITHTENGTQ